MRKIIVIARPNVKKEKIEVVDEITLRVFVKAPPEDNRANEAICRVVAGFFGVPTQVVKMYRGFKGKRKYLHIG